MAAGAAKRLALADRTTAYGRGSRVHPHAGRRHGGRAASGGGSKTSRTASSQSASRPGSTNVTPAATAADDARAKAAIERALKVIASDYRDFGDYSLVTPYTLRNLDHRLRAVPTLAAHGQAKTFYVSVRSMSGTTFVVRGGGLQLRRTCAPAGAGCPGGNWSGATRLALPKVPVVTAATKARVREILTSSVDHYAHLLALGEQALGSTQYANATVGLAAFNDPNSAASRFRDYRKKSDPEGDLSFLNAFKKADGYYTAANEPNSIGTWRDDMSLVGSDLSEWVNVAVAWQIREHTTAQLQAAEHKFEAALAKARRDIADVVAGR